MTRRRALAPIVALSLLAATAGQAAATPITYTLGLSASGVVDGRPFTDEPAKVQLRADTADVSTGPDGTTLTVDCSHGGCTGLVAGIGFGIASIVKFKQHKDNPTQITVTVVGKNIERLFLAKPRFATYKLGTPIGPIEVPVAFKAPLTVHVTVNGRPSTVTINSIAGNRVRFEAK